ncbi:MAG: orotidine-5'-phosphate decarboxylase [Nitrosospira sp.]|nr:orotidine-5'-phosphate decarboxylase [Nitrosospira sp.]MBI0416725.1 orotidine-5'-phosphate decarboxylase [Nitrosospira sp.]MBI0419000.1 orotidine-5'-phosphate decarboxylase [Nitrosospira sp.]
MNDPRIIVALDFSTAKQALMLVDRLDRKLCRVKIGKELFTAAGPQLVEKLINKNFEVFLDLKFHDIPNTVANACKVASNLGVWMINVHALGGKKMLSAAREALPLGTTKLVAVTLLTSLGNDDLSIIGLKEEPESLIQKLSNLARSCGLDGVVCSGLETAQLRQTMGKEFCLVTPGIRPVNFSANDQQRVTTPRQAIESGADYIVIGRPITQAADPLMVLWQVSDEIRRS